VQAANQTGKEICSSVSRGKPFGGIHIAQFISQAAQEMALWKQTAALIDQSWMLRPAHWLETFEPITADFTYVRWLGNRKGILLASF